MKLTYALIAFISLSTAWAAPSNLPSPALHLDPEMTGPEYRSLVEFQKLKLAPRDALRAILNVGKRNLDWLDRINQSRTEADRMDLWTEANTQAYPIEAPSISNRSIIQERWTALLDEMPSAMKDVLLATGTVPNTTPLADAEYLEWARKTDKVYQQASRWLLQEPSLFAYAARARDDVRGYVTLTKETDLEAKLAAWANLDAETKQRLTTALIGICKNSGATHSRCSQEISRVNGSAADLYRKYFPRARTLYESYFKIGSARRDVRWNDAANSCQIPFLEPDTQEVRDWLVSNIEDEWKWNGWSLKLAFQPSGNVTYVRFVAGATPNVNGLAGNRITMDANRPLDHYSTRWTIRHEYGHVLGFPDCYVEFYDEAEGVMVNYQLDITNLMCSRRGKLQAKHYEEMRRVYR